MARSSWRKMIQNEMEESGETWGDVEATTLTDAELDVMFNNGYGGSEGKPFTLWTHNRVYFPVVYDGAEWVGSAPRNPCEEATGHMGGE